MFKQPRVPEYRESEGAAKHLKALTLFLKDFCQDVWTASRNADKATQKVQEGVDSIKYPVTSVNKKTGDVELGAGDVGALPADSAAKDAGKLGGKTWAELVQEVYPVGSVYMSADATSPASLFGGTWEQMKDRFLLGAGGAYSAGGTGGAETVTLTTSQIPAHTHAVHSRSVYSGGGSYIGFCNEANSTNSYVTGSRGGGEAHDNMPPYVAVYMWKRVS